MCQSKLLRYNLHQLFFAVLITVNSPVLGFSSFLDTCWVSPGSFGRGQIDSSHRFRCALYAEREGLVSTICQGREDQVDTSVASPSSRPRRKPSESSVAYFETRFQELLEYQKIHGHTRVPKRQGQLGGWVNKLRQRKDRLLEERLERLNEIGFCWDARDGKRRERQTRWWKQLESLPKKQGQLSNPATKSGGEPTSSRDTELSQTSPRQQSSLLSFDNMTTSQKTWLRRQRMAYIDAGYKPSQKLDEEQIQALNNIDRDWWKTARERKWDAQYSALKAFKLKHGHCNVMATHNEKKLFNWVQNTRKSYRAVKFHKEDGLRSDGSPKLSSMQIELLDRIGFTWDPWGHYADYC